MKDPLRISRHKDSQYLTWDVPDPQMTTAILRRYLQRIVISFCFSLPDYLWKRVLGWMDRTFISYLGLTEEGSYASDQIISRCDTAPGCFSQELK